MTGDGRRRAASGRPAAKLIAATLIAAHLVATALLLAGCAATGTPGQCSMRTVAALKLIDDVRLPAVQATLDGRRVIVLIDTGARVSVVSSDAAEALSLPRVWEHSVLLEGINGVLRAPVVQLRRLDLGHGVARDLDLPVAGHFGRDTIDGMPVLGVFGADFLSNYDVELDEPGHRFAIYRLSGCGSRLQPLDAPAFAMPFKLVDTKIVLDLGLDGVPVAGVLDSGSMRSVITRADAGRAGVDAARLAADRPARMVGIDMNPLDGRVHRFVSLQIGAEQWRNVRLTVGETPASLLGDDFLRFNRVWISYPLHRLFIQPVIPDWLRPPPRRAEAPGDAPELPASGAPPRRPQTQG